MKPLSLVALCFFSGGCGSRNTSSYVQSPGQPTAAKTRALETGSAMLQSKPPISALNTYLDGFHFYNGMQQAQMEAHHYCANLNEDLTQCVIFDGNSRESKLMGVEYIVSRALFITLPESERKLWHSHNFEVTSGELIAPGVPKAAEHELMQKIASTYGKTWHTWNTDQAKTLPTGVPQLMMGFTADGQINKPMEQARDARFNVSTAERQALRKDIHPPAVAEGANAWQQGAAMQLRLAPAGSRHD